MRPLRVFLVENHQDSAKYIRLYLEHLGHEVTAVQDMATALNHHLVKPFLPSELVALLQKAGAVVGNQENGR